MKVIRVAVAILFVAVCAQAQDFVPPPVLVTPAMTSDVVVVDTVIATNTTFTTNQVSRHALVVTTNATLRRFVIDIDTNQVPTRFTSYMSDGSLVVTAAGSVASLSNRPALSTFNGLLVDVMANGHRCFNTNMLWRGSATNAARRVFTGGSRTNQWHYTGR